MGANPPLRASDGDRERAAAEIREHFAQGRLKQEELSQRLERAYSAETTAELEALRADLPALPAHPSAARAAQVARRSELSRHLVQETGAALAPFLVCTLIWLLAGADSNFWPAWLLILPAVLLVKNGWRLYGPAPDHDAVSRDLARHRQERGRGPNASRSLGRSLRRAEAPSGSNPLYGEPAELEPRRSEPSAADVPEPSANVQRVLEGPHGIGAAMSRESSH
jgi:hypothetical protein